MRPPSPLPVLLAFVVLVVPSVLQVLRVLFPASSIGIRLSEEAEESLCAERQLDVDEGLSVTETDEGHRRTEALLGAHVAHHSHQISVRV